MTHTRLCLGLLLVAGCQFHHGKLMSDGGGDDAGPPDTVIVPDGGICEAASIECTTGDVLRTCSAPGEAYVDKACAWGCLDSGGAHCAQATPSGGALMSSDLTTFAGFADLSLTGTLILNGGDGAIGTTGDPESIRAAVNNTDNGIFFQVRSGVAVFKFKKLTIDGSLKLIGTNSIVLLADDDITITGIVDARGACTNEEPGPGGFAGGISKANGGGTGGGTGASAAKVGAGGGGHGAMGGTGGTDTVGTPGATGGIAFGDVLIAILSGGAGGGGGSGGAPVGGGGGGAVQLFSNHAIIIMGNGMINAGGCGGETKGGGMDGGGGGGAGGALLLEAPAITIGGVLAVNGGGGGGGDGTSGFGEPGSFDRTRAAGGTGMASGGLGGAGGNLTGGDGQTVATKAGGGGGGAVGRIRLNTKRDAGLTTAGSTMSPDLTDANSTCTRGAEPTF